jgi:hypothetical protein
MKRVSRYFYLIILAAPLGGCQSFFSNYVQISNATYPKVPPGDVEIFVSKAPSKEYEELGLVSIPIARGDEHSKVFTNFRVVVAQHGGNAIINVQLHGTYLTGLAVRWK